MRNLALTRFITVVIIISKNCFLIYALQYTFYFEVGKEKLLIVFQYLPTGNLATK